MYKIVICCCCLSCYMFIALNGRKEIKLIAVRLPTSHRHSTAGRRLLWRLLMVLQSLLRHWIPRLHLLYPVAVWVPINCCRNARRGEMSARLVRAAVKCNDYRLLILLMFILIFCYNTRRQAMKQI